MSVKGQSLQADTSKNCSERPAMLTVLQNSYFFFPGPDSCIAIPTFWIFDSLKCHPNLYNTLGLY